MKNYTTISELLLAMVTSGELTKKQVQTFRDVQETERAEWRNKMIHLVNEAYGAGTKHNSFEREELVDEIRMGAHDV